MTIPAGLFYATLEDVKGAMDVKLTARSDAQIRRRLASGTESVEAQLHRSFYPQRDTRYFPWPGTQKAPSWILRLDRDELADDSITLVAGGVTLSSSDYLLEPGNSGPPYTRIEIKLSSSSAFAAEDTHQRQIAVTGLFGHSADEAVAGTITEALDASETGVDVSDSAAIGVGNVIRIDSERMIVQGKTMLDTGQNCSALTDAVNAVTITGITAGTIAVDEVILVDSERMLVVDVAGTTLTVKRAWDGTIPAAHLNGADIYAPRTLQVTRGALGTSAAAHDTGTAIARHVVPALAQELCLAETINLLMQGQSGYARMVGSGENARESSGRGLRQIRDDAYTALGRKARKRVV